VLTSDSGTYAGGWRIIRTLGQRIYKMQPEHGFAAQIAAGTTLWAGTHYGFPISTTQVVTGSVMGAGATRRFSAVRWGLAGNILLAWLLTLPAAGLVAAALYYPVRWIF
jgi:PiT family inorganic phosphate transporter